MPQCVAVLAKMNSTSASHACDMHPLCVLSEQNVKTIVTVKDNFYTEEKAGCDFVTHQAQPLSPELSPGLLG